MRLEDFEYDLPPDLIAQVPLPERDASRLMVLDRDTGAIRHKRFTDLPELIGPGDLLILNDTRVIAARLVGRRAAPGTGGRVETLCVERVAGPGEGARWKAMLSGTRRAGETIDYGGGLTGRVIESLGGGIHLVEFTAAGGEDPEASIVRRGRMPLPPYIRRGADGASAAAFDRIDRDRYQTVVASVPGAVAAPTAGLHFTEALIARVRRRGAQVETLTLHVGPGTFQPIRVEEIERHRMMPEAFAIPAQVSAAVDGARRGGGRVIAVGTTVTRALEGNADGRGGVRAGEGRCDLFIRPGHRFGVVDALITNFHLPRSTLLILVAAFAGRDAVLNAYRAAIAEGYRFYSYGDAMLIAPSAPGGTRNA